MNILNTSDICAYIESRGYGRVAIPLFGKSDRWYELKSSDGPIVHVIYLEYKSRYKAFNVVVGAYLPEIIDELKLKLPRLARFMADPSDEKRYASKRCFHLGSASRALDWPLLMIPNPLSPETASAQLEALFSSFIEPRLCTIRDRRALVSHLLDNRCPFEWVATGTPMRVAEAFALSRGLDISYSELIDELRPYETILSFRTASGMTFSELMSGLWEEVR